jgi:3-oxoacyl-[acyl-carrier-protein] synthase-3
MNYKRSRILSVGTAVPETVITNKDFEKYLDTSNEWIVKRTGIHQRHVFPRDADASAAELGSRAARQALDRAGIGPEAIDGVVCATSTPDAFFPSTACSISRILGREDVFAFDISAACAGFVYGLTIVNSLILSGQCRSVLLVGSEITSKTLDWNDRSTCILFGDGAGAVVMQGSEDDSAGILAAHISSVGSLGDILTLPAWGEPRVISMNGNEVFKHAVRMMSEATDRCLERAALGREEVDLLIPHQANSRIISALARHMALPMENVVMNIDRYGNTSAASIPLALNDAWQDGRIGPGTTAVLTSLGGGITVGSAVVRF